ncbi:MAG: hypothetical protein ABL958_09230 [Bdellovibrionia bacterium]
MKLAIALLLASATVQAAPIEYACLDAQRTQATLKVKNAKSLVWNDVSHSAVSRGNFDGIETSPFSNRKGYRTYQLVDFHITADSAFYVDVQPQALTGAAKIIATVYYDTDGHEEDTTPFRCVRTR